MADDDRMGILFDHQILAAQKYGGISRYFYEIAMHLLESEEFRPIVSAPFHQNYYFERYFQKKSVSSRKFNRFYLFYRIMDELALHLHNDRNCKIYHPTYYSGTLIGHFKGKTVLTVHDMIYEQYREELKSAERMIRLKDNAVHKADYLIAISENTKQDILRYYPDIKEEKITVIYHGNSFAGVKERVPRITLPEKYLLFVGMRTLYKNFDNFLQAVVPFLQQDEDLFLVCSAGGAFSKEELGSLDRLKIKEKVIRLDVTDEELMYLYRHALFFVFPSKYEGFGMPILEAWENECPVALSHASCFPEIAGDAAVYFDPEEVEDIRSCLERLLNDKELRFNLIEKGKGAVKKFGIEKMVEDTERLYRRAAGEC